MTTPDEFVSRVQATVAELALALAHTPHERQEAVLHSFANAVRAQWRALFSPVLSADDVDGMVEDVLARILARRREIEAAAVGSA